MSSVAEQAGVGPHAAGGRPQRALPAATGAAFAVLVVVGNMIYTDGNRETLGFAIELLGYVALAAFVAWAVAGLRGAVEWAGLLAIFGGAAMMAVKLGGWAALFASKQVAAPEVTAALIQIDDAAWVLAWMPYGLLLGALSYAALRADKLPRPMAWLGVVLGFACIAAVPFSMSEPFVLPWLISLVWLIVASVMLALRGGQRAVADKAWSVEV